MVVFSLTKPLRCVISKVQPLVVTYYSCRWNIDDSFGIGSMDAIPPVAASSCCTGHQAGLKICATPSRIVHADTPALDQQQRCSTASGNNCRGNKCRGDPGQHVSGVGDLLQDRVHRLPLDENVHSLPLADAAAFPCLVQHSPRALHRHLHLSSS